MGFYVIALILLFILVHLVPMVRHDFWRIRHILRKQYYKRKF